MFHTLALTGIPPTNDIGDSDLPDWCPPSNNPGLSVICGTIVSAGVVEVLPGTHQAGAPIDKVMVAAYEENIISPTGKLSGALTNIFSSTTTNKLGRYRITVRKVKPPRLKVHLVFFCGPQKAQEIVVDSWHNTWNMTTQINCAQKIKSSPVDDNKIPQPPFPLPASASASSFMGCTNDRMGDTAIGLAKREQPTINTIINEDNYDHRFNLNPVTVVTEIPYYYTWSFTSPGGLWEPDCLLRNEEGIYQCNTLTCRTWEKPDIKQPCVIDTCKLANGADGVRVNGKCVPKDKNTPSTKDCGITAGYTGVKIYAVDSCTPNPTEINSDGTLTAGEQERVDKCKKKNKETVDDYIAKEKKLPTDPIDGVLCDGGTPMVTEDYLTRPFFKYIPKGPGDYEPPFRRFEYRNNLQNFAIDPLMPMQWINTYIGSAANSGTGIPLVTGRSFAGAISTTPDVPNCEALYQRNLPYQDKGVPVTQNRLINTGYITALSEPNSTYDETYYSGQKDLSAYVCQQSSGELIRICEIQVPWGSAAICDIHRSGCKDADLKSNLRKSLNRLVAAGTLVDPNTVAETTNNINNMLNLCGKDFKLGKRYFPQDLIFKAGNTQMGFQSTTPNDSIPAGAERGDDFIPASTEQKNQARTGSRVVFQEGGKFMANSFDTILCAINPKVCNNNKNADSLTDSLTYPYAETYEDVKRIYLNDTTWEVDSLGPGQTSMCSISNIYKVDITGPEQEIAGVPSMGSNATTSEDATKKAILQGGYFDQLFTKNSQHKDEIAVGTASWYMSSGAFKRDKTTMTGGGLGAFLALNFWGDDGSTNVGTSSDFINKWAFSSLFGRDVWDSMLTLAGGDANLHNLEFPLKGIGASILGSLAANNPLKSYGDRQASAESGTSTPNFMVKPYYSVTFDYPLTEASFKEKFKLPGLTEVENSAPIYVHTELRPEDWGPGHICYGFDTAVPPGQICGTYREDVGIEEIKGVSRTCRVDKCVAFNRVETATCKCTRKRIGGTADEPIYEAPEKAKCGIVKNSREDRNLIIRDCTRDNRLMCANLQETSRAWDQLKDGYDRARCKRVVNDTCVEYSPYFLDKRTGQETTGIIMPPDDIDDTIQANDQKDHVGGYQDPPVIPDTPERCNSGMFDWEPNQGTKEKGLVGPENNVRPRCWVSAAGPFRKFPNFSAVGQTTPQPIRKDSGQEIKNCNGYIKIGDSALRATQEAPYQDSGQIQHSLDESTLIGIKILKTFTAPYSPSWGGNALALIDSKETNNGLVASDGLKTDTYTRGQIVNMGGVGDVSTIRSFFTPPSIVPIFGREGELRPMYYHCDYKSSHTLDTKNKKQKEYFSMMSAFDPDLDGIGGWKCPIVPPPDPQIPNIEGKSAGNCSIKQFEKCELALKALWGSSPEVNNFHFSETFKNIINWTAYQSNTPGGALMAIMFLESGLDVQYLQKWSDDAWVFNSGVPWYGQMDLGGPATCNDLVWTAQGPFMEIQKWVECLVNPTSTRCFGPNASEASKEISKRFCATLNKAGRGRCESILNAGRCNLLDAATIASFFMNPRAGMSPGNCSGFNLDAALQLYSGGSYELETGGDANNVAAQIYAACK